MAWYNSWDDFKSGVSSFISGGPTGEQKDNRKMLQDYYTQVQGRQMPTLGPTSYGSVSNFRNNQSDLISRLEAMSKGEGPSLAGEQLKAATDRNIRSQAAFANTGRGGPLAAQQAANNTAFLGAQSAQDAAQARIGEQQMALNQLGLTLHGARGADEEMSRFNAGQGNEMKQADLAGRLKAMGLNDDAILRTLGLLSGNANASATQASGAERILAGGANLLAMTGSGRKK
jgi:hypothetical protein